MPLRKRNASKARALTASAVKVDIGNKVQAVKIRRLRQSWQEDAWSYRDAIPEIGYAMRFKATAVSRMRLYVAMWVEGEDQPVPLDENPPGLPAGLADAANRALEELAPGRMGHANLLRNLNENIEVAGECYLLGQQDAASGEQEFSIKSIDELVANTDGKWLLRDQPAANGSASIGVEVGADAYIARMWCPHPRFSVWADSPMRSLLESGEELLLLSRSIRAATRSRLANAGILGIASELSFASTTAGGDDDDPEADPFMAQLIDAMVTPISDEASASAVIPIVVRGPADMLEKGIVYKPMIRPADDRAATDRAELIGRIANGLDIPREILTGVADLNHWSAWQVDDSTFRYHIEPAVLRAVDSLTVGYFRPRIIGGEDGQAGYDPEIVKQLVIWYDPTELVTHPDRTKDALDLFDREGLSLAALREAGGWTDDDAPDDDEYLVRLLSKTRTFPPNVVEALFHKVAPGLVIPADKNEPGMGPTGEIPPDETAPAIAPKSTPAIEGPAKSPQPGQGGTPPAVAASVMAALVAAGRVDVTSSARLARIDASLRDTVLAATDQAMHRALERAGNKVKGKAPNALKASLSGVAPDRICATLGQAVVASYGMSEHSLLEEAFAALSERFWTWVDGANRSALATAVKMLRLPIDDPKVTGTRQKQETAAKGAWVWLKGALHARAIDLLYHPQETDTDQTATASGASLVPVGLVRGALALAGGYAGQGVTDLGAPVDGSTPLGGIGSGPIIGGLLRTCGAEIDHYLWVHGISRNPFEPHLELDGTEFTQFTDGRLANSGEQWVGNRFYFPGDHDGCSCDIQYLWTDSGHGTTQADTGLAASV